MYNWVGDRERLYDWLIHTFSNLNVNLQDKRTWFILEDVIVVGQIPLLESLVERKLLLMNFHGTFMFPLERIRAVEELSFPMNGS